MTFTCTMKRIAVVDNEKTGARLRKLRVKAGLSLREVSRRMGISAPYLSDLEHGKRTWTQDKADAFLDALEGWKAT